MNVLNSILGLNLYNCWYIKNTYLPIRGWKRFVIYFFPFSFFLSQIIYCIFADPLMPTIDLFIMPFLSPRDFVAGDCPAANNFSRRCRSAGRCRGRLPAFVPRSYLLSQQWGRMRQAAGDQLWTKERQDLIPVGDYDSLMRFCTH